MNEFWNIERANIDDNISGGHRFIFINPGDILTEPEVINNNIVDPFTLKPGAVWYTADFTEMTLRYDEIPSTKGGNAHTTIKLSGLIPFASIQNLNLLYRMAKKGLVIIYYDNNSIAKVIGSKDCPAFLERNTTHGSIRKANASSFNIKSITGIQGAPFYNSTTPAIKTCIQLTSIQGLFTQFSPDLPDYYIGANEVGVYPYIVTDGVSDPITIYINDIVATAPFTFLLGDKLSAIRFDVSSPGWFKIYQ